MSGEPQLERSVLEAKERDKLQAIADALGLKPTARTKKAELIDGILRATGVEVAPAPEPAPAKPRRATRKRAAEVPPADESAATRSADAPGPDDAVPPAVDDRPPIGSGGNVEPARSEGHEPKGSGGREEPADLGGREEPAGPGGREEPAGSSGAREPVVGGPAGGNGTGQAAAPSPAPRPAHPPGPPGPGNHAVPPPPSQGQGQGQVNQQPPSPGAPAEGGDVRRNRRRRGRDRERVGAGYDQHSQQADQAYSGDPLPCDGLLEVRPEGYGFLRTKGYAAGPDDVYVSTSQVRRFALRAGDRIVGASRPPTTQERFGALLRIDAVGDQSPEDARRRPRFEDLTPVFPDERLTLELGEPADPADVTGRIIDLLAPIGKGQRGMIVSPPRAGKTTVVKHIAKAIEANHSDVDLIVLLIDERPEEVTDMRRSVQGEVIGSTFDRPAEEHTAVAELAIEVAKRRAELGRDVVVILDGLTRLTRAYNLALSPTGRVLAGGIDAGALQPSKRLFGAARNLEEGGSLTILATALVGTGSAMDTDIFDELRDTGNAELRLDRGLAERRLYPAIDIAASSTRHEELLLTQEELDLIWQLRRALVAADTDGSGDKGHQLLIGLLKQSRTNTDVLAGIARSPASLAGTAGDPLRLEGSL